MLNWRTRNRFIGSASARSFLERRSTSRRDYGTTLYRGGRFGWILAKDETVDLRGRRAIERANSSPRRRCGHAVLILRNDARFGRVRCGGDRGGSMIILAGCVFD